MTDTSVTLLKGTVDLLILAALGEGGAKHGYGIAEWIETSTAGDLLLEEGTLYPALHRLQRKGFLTSEWGASENNRRARYYRLTRQGVEARTKAMKEWDRYSRAVSAALKPGAAR
ncbi:MAG: PadR family transcriptional regulator [Gemmatimonadales bacterium]|nr:MAG: PadR family transcriptional regulator [Gemmatimonadales bacterium]